MVGGPFPEPTRVSLSRGTLVLWKDDHYYCSCGRCKGYHWYTTADTETPDVSRSGQCWKKTGSSSVRIELAVAIVGSALAHLATITSRKSPENRQQHDSNN